MLWLALVAVLAHTALTAEDPHAYYEYLSDNKASAIVADIIQSKITPLYTGYSAINEAVPVKIMVNCHYGPQPYPSPSAASNSTSARKYVSDIAYIVGDGYRPATHIEPKQDYNQSWGLGLVWGGSCIFDAEHRPACNFTLNAASRASGLAQITRVPDSNIKFVSCGIYLDSNIVNSTTCFQDDSTTVVPVTGAYAEENIGLIQFFSTFQDLSASGPPGTYTLSYACQYGWNTESVFNPVGNLLGLDPRLTGVLPNTQNGFFGPAGNGGNLGRRLLKGLWH